MKQMVETDVCDICHEERKSYECCDGCKKLFCSYCFRRDNGLIIYPHIRFVKHEDELLYAMNSSYLGDGKYCKSCDDRLALEGTDKLFLAFRNLRDFISHSKKVHAELQKTGDRLESEIRQIRKPKEIDGNLKAKVTIT